MDDYDDDGDSARIHRLERKVEELENKLRQVETDLRTAVYLIKHARDHADAI